MTYTDYAYADLDQPFIPAHSPEVNRVRLVGAITKFTARSASGTTVIDFIIAGQYLDPQHQTRNFYQRVNAIGLHATDFAHSLQGNGPWIAEVEGILQDPHWDMNAKGLIISGKKLNLIPVKGHKFEFDSKGKALLLKGTNEITLTGFVEHAGHIYHGPKAKGRKLDVAFGKGQHVEAFLWRELADQVPPIGRVTIKGSLYAGQYVGKNENPIVNMNIAVSSITATALEASKPVRAANSRPLLKRHSKSRGLSWAA